MLYSRIYSNTILSIRLFSSVIIVPNPRFSEKPVILIVFNGEKSCLSLKSFYRLTSAIFFRNLYTYHNENDVQCKRQPVKPLFFLGLNKSEDNFQENISHSGMWRLFFTILYFSRLIWLIIMFKNIALVKNVFLFHFLWWCKAECLVSLSYKIICNKFTWHDSSYLVIISENIWTSEWMSKVQCKNKNTKGKQNKTKITTNN